jgi:hypothetical protein
MRKISKCRQDTLDEIQGLAAHIFCVDSESLGPRDEMQLIRWITTLARRTKNNRPLRQVIIERLISLQGFSQEPSSFDHLNPRMAYRRGYASATTDAVRVVHEIFDAEEGRK